MSMPKLYQCSLCGRVDFWGPTHSYFSSFKVDDEYPSYRIIACSEACAKEAERRREAGTIALPKIGQRGYSSHLIAAAVGYKSQPEQSVLLAIWQKEQGKTPQPITQQIEYETHP